MNTILLILTGGTIGSAKKKNIVNVSKNNHLKSYLLKNNKKSQSHQKINKFKEDNALLSQSWVMEPKKKVKDILKELSISDLKIKDFYRLKIGE